MSAPRRRAPLAADVIALDLGTRQIAWRVKVDGYGALAGRHALLVSASTAGKVHVIDTARCDRRRVRLGDQPHENTFLRDGSRILHASIGSVDTPLDLPEFDLESGRPLPSRDPRDRRGRQRRRATARALPHRPLTRTGQPGRDTTDIRPMRFRSPRPQGRHPLCGSC